MPYSRDQLMRDFYGLTPLPDKKPIKKRGKNPETVIVHAIMQYLLLKKIFAFRLNNIPVAIKDKFGNFKGFRPVAVKGIADICAILPGGKCLMIEVKTMTGRQSDDQKRFEKAVVKAGGMYVLARSIDDIQKVVELYTEIS